MHLDYLDLRDQMDDLALEEQVEAMVRRATRVKRAHEVTQVLLVNQVVRENQDPRDLKDQVEMMVRREHKDPLDHLAKREIEDLRVLLDRLVL